jgi:very-short-patch-repair endonuclease
MRFDKYGLPSVCTGAPVSENMRWRAREGRKHGTAAERAAWQILRARRCLGLRFRRQQPIGPFIADFYCPELRLVIEVDGAIHHSAEQRYYDAIREHVLAMLGVIVVRMANEAASPENLEALIRRVMR